MCKRRHQAGSVPSDDPAAPLLAEGGDIEASAQPPLHDASRTLHTPLLARLRQRLLPARSPGLWEGEERPPPPAPGVYWEIVAFALPMLATLAADPVASLVDTAYIGHLGTVPLAGVGLALSIFNSITRLLNAPLLAVTTSRVATAAAAVEAAAAAKQQQQQQQQLSADDGASSAGDDHEGSSGEEEEEEEGVEAGRATPLLSKRRRRRRHCRTTRARGEGEGAATVVEVGGVAVKAAPTVGAGGEAPASRTFDIAVWQGCRGGSGGAPLSPQMCGCERCRSGGDGGGGGGLRLHGGRAEVAGAAVVAADGSPRGGGGDGNEERPRAVKAQPADLEAAVASAMALAVAFGTLEAVVLVAGGPSAAALWGAPPGSRLRESTLQFLRIRGLGAPIMVGMLSLQGVFRGLADATTPLVATLGCTLLNVGLEPLFIFRAGLGVRGSAAATVLAQLLPAVGMLWWLVAARGINPLSVRRLQWRALLQMFGPTGYLVLRTISISAVYAMGTSLAARAGPLAAAAHQIAFQLWMAASLLSDSLAVSVQTLLARAVAAGQQRHARALVHAGVVLATGLGLALTAALAVGSGALPALFTQDAQVLATVRRLMPFVYGTQVINCLAFVWDGVLYGAGGFQYAALIMLACAAPALGAMGLGLALAMDDPAAAGAGGDDAGVQWGLLVAVWAGMSVLMVMRMVTISIPYHLRRYPFEELYRPEPLLCPPSPNAGPYTPHAQHPFFALSPSGEEGSGDAALAATPPPDDADAAGATQTPALLRVAPGGSGLGGGSTPGGSSPVGLPPKRGGSYSQMGAWLDADHPVVAMSRNASFVLLTSLDGRGTGGGGFGGGGVAGSSASSSVAALAPLLALAEADGGGGGGGVTPENAGVGGPPSGSQPCNGGAR